MRHSRRRRACGEGAEVVAVGEGEALVAAAAIGAWVGLGRRAIGRGPAIAPSIAVPATTIRRRLKLERASERKKVQGTNGASKGGREVHAPLSHTPGRLDPGRRRSPGCRSNSAPRQSSAAPTPTSSRAARRAQVAEVHSCRSKWQSLIEKRYQCL